MKSLTVFTPTYNRAFCLGQVYNSLCRQKSTDFCWLIIDDGSTDNTKQLVDSWINEGKVDITYIYKKNGGMHTAHNAAYNHIKTELNVCIDSDDYMPDDAVHQILEMWSAYGSRNLAGIIGLDAFKDGRIVGSAMPQHISQSKLTDLYQKHGVTGDKKLVIRTEVVNKYPRYPEYENERLVPLGTLYRMIDSDYVFLCTNQVLCIVEYLADGSSNNIFRQYRQSPQGFYYARIVEMKYSKKIYYTFTRAIHLVSSSIFSGKLNVFENNPNVLITVLAFPFGIALNLYLRYKIRK